MEIKFKNALSAILWTGGKDSCLALHRAHEQGIPISCLATFVPDRDSEFKAHPLVDMKKQADSLNLPLYIIPVGEPYREGYIAGLKALRDKYRITSVITGDIDFINGFPNWILECCTHIKVNVIRPLWKENRKQLMNELLKRKIEAKITWVDCPLIPKTWIGQTIDKKLLKKLLNHTKKSKIDICGENGEYHTMVVNAPLFQHRIQMVGGKDSYNLGPLH